MAVVSGGNFESAFIGRSDADLEVTGGSINGPISMESGVNLRLVGAEFRLIDINSGALIEDLTPALKGLAVGETIEIPQRDVAIEGILGDGNPFRFDLNSIQFDGEDFADLAANILVARELPSLIHPTIVTFVRGILVSESGFELNLDARLSDDRRIQILRGFALGTTTPLAELRFETTLPVLPTAKQELRFMVESSAGTPGLTGVIQTRNYSTGFFDTLASFDAPFNADSVMTVVLTDEHFDPDTLEVLGRLTWWPTGFLLNDPWEVRLDHAFWSIE